MQRGRNLPANLLPFDIWKIAQEMIRRGVDAVEIEIVKPLSHFLDAVGKFDRIVEVRS